MSPYKTWLIIVKIPFSRCCFQCLVSWNIKFIKNNTKFIFISILIFLLYLTKSTMFFLCIFLPFFIIFFEKKNKLILLTFVFLILSIFAWGIFGKIKTGRFPFGQSITTWNSWIINHALNKELLVHLPFDP